MLSTTLPALKRLSTEMGDSNDGLALPIAGKEW